MNLPEDVNRIINRYIKFTLARNIEHYVPDKPGIYAWFYPLQFQFDCFDDSDLKDEKVEKITNSIRNYEELSRSYYKLFTEEGDLQNFKITLLKKDINLQDELIIDNITNLTKDQRRELYSTFFTFSIFNPPFYIGQTENQGLKTRLLQHRDGEISEKKNTLKRRVKELTGRDDFLKNCLIAFVPFEQKTQDLIPRIIEHLLIRQIQPIQSKRG